MAGELSSGWGAGYAGHTYAGEATRLLEVTVTRDQTGVSRITQVVSRDQTGVARITATATRDQTGIARITIVTTRDQTGVANILNSIARPQTGVANILNTTTRDQTGVASIVYTTQRPQTGRAFIVARLLNGKPRTVIVHERSVVDTLPVNPRVSVVQVESRIVDDHTPPPRVNTRPVKPRLK